MAIEDPTLKQQFDYVQSQRVRLGFENRDMRHLLKQAYCMLKYGDIVEDQDGCDIKSVVMCAIRDKLEELNEIL
jgi:hypothetical protein